MNVTATKELSRAVSLFHALSDETRLEILHRLKNGEQCVCDLMDALKSAQSRLSFHLKVLKEAGLIEDRREGRWMYYALKLDVFEELEELIGTLKNTASSSYPSKRCT
jgi:ArsR family transcriptional regulator, arsenate/arsenite/antimonite-responsive transcriptional repressor